MPKVKKQRKSSSSDSDSGPDDRTPTKKSKVVEPPKKSESNFSKEENRWEISKNRFVSLTEFKGKWYVSIREFYLDSNGDQKPGKKGIMMNMEQWEKFKSFIPDLEEAIKANV